MVDRLFLKRSCRIQLPCAALAGHRSARPVIHKVSFRNADVEGFNILYREAGPRDAQTLLLLHGFPSASHMFRDLVPGLADRFHIIAPDLPGFGQSDMPDRSAFAYTFRNIARVIDRFTEVVGLDRFAIYVFDDGVPAGDVAPGARRRNYLAERKCLYGGAKRRLETDPGLLGRPVADQPRCVTRLLGARDDGLAIHARRPRHDDGLARRLLAR